LRAQTPLDRLQLLFLFFLNQLPTSQRQTQAIGLRLSEKKLRVCSEPKVPI
jgi:hypothetical protein